jgi:hypothetical protein
VTFRPVLKNENSGHFIDIPIREIRPFVSRARCSRIVASHPFKRRPRPAVIKEGDSKEAVGLFFDRESVAEETDVAAEGAGTVDRPSLL